MGGNAAHDRQKKVFMGKVAPSPCPYAKVILMKIIPKVYLTHADRRATLCLDFRLSIRRHMMTTSAHNLIGLAATLEAALI